MYRVRRPHCINLRWVLWQQPSDVSPTSGGYHVSEWEQLQQYSRRSFTSMILFTRKLAVDFPKETFSRNMTTVNDDPWKSPKPTDLKFGTQGGRVLFGGGPPYDRHPDDLTDEYDNDNNNIDVEEIQRLINERNVARRSRDFMVANRIRTQLKSQYGVVLNDQERTWSTNPENVGRSNYMNYVPVEDFGPTGHDYQRAANAGKSISPIPEDVMHQLIAERRLCKLSRDFHRADEIQQQLNDMHIQLCDENKLWRSDGKRFASSMYDYSYAPEAGPISSSMPEEQILAYLRERLACRFNRDFTTADAIRNKLEAAGVYVHDVDCMWRADGVPFPRFRGRRT